MTQNVLVLHVSQYDFVNEVTKEQLRGTTVKYVTDPVLNTVKDEARKSMGLHVAKASLPFEAYDKFVEAPAIYEFTLELKSDSKGKLAAVPIDMRYIEGVTTRKRKEATT